MDYLYRKTITTQTGEKYISVYICDVRDIAETVDILTVSAFYRGYAPTPGTLLGALDELGISVHALAKEPAIDLRNISNIWLSGEIQNSKLPVGRIGCIEMSPYRKDRGLWKEKTTDIISSIQSYFRMLDIASLSGIKLETIALPLLGTGSQNIDMGLTAIPLLNECICFLKQNPQIQEIKIIERRPEKAFQFAKILDTSYSIQQESARSNSKNIPEEDRLAFISYSSADKNIADNLCSKMESAGIRVWYAPRDIVYDDYASSIVNAISRCTHFVVILSKNSLKSNHVLNEIDLSFQEVAKRNLHFCPLKIDEEEMGPAFRYYLSRQHWMDAHVPPIEKRLDEFVEMFCSQNI